MTGSGKKGGGGGAPGQPGGKAGRLAPTALHHQFLLFGLAGGIAFVVDASVLQLLVKLVGLNPFAGRLVSFLCALTTTWLINRNFAFAALRGGRGLVSEALHYALANSMGGAINYAIYSICVLAWPLAYREPVLAVAAGSGVTMMFNFTANRFFVFGRRRSGAAAKPGGEAG